MKAFCTILPDVSTLGLMFKKAGLHPATLEEADDLYWAEAERV